MAKPKKKPLPADVYNPFKGRDPQEVWKEISGKTTPISREEFLKRIKESSSKKDV